MSYSRRQLYAMGEPLGESVTRKEGGRIIYGGGGGGGGGGGSAEVATPATPTVIAPPPAPYANMAVNTQQGYDTLQGMRGTPWEKSGTAYNELLNQGFNSSQIKDSASQMYGKPSDSNWSGMVQNAGMNSPTGRPMAGSEQFFQPVYQQQYQNYANPLTAFNVSSYGTNPGPSAAQQYANSPNGIGQAQFMRNTQNYAANAMNQPGGADMNRTLQEMRTNGMNPQDVQSAYNFGAPQQSFQMPTPFNPYSSSSGGGGGYGSMGGGGYGSMGGGGYGSMGGGQMQNSIQQPAPQTSMFGGQMQGGGYGSYGSNNPFSPYSNSYLNLDPNINLGTQTDKANAYRSAIQNGFGDQQIYNQATGLFGQQSPQGWGNLQASAMGMTPGLAQGSEADKVKFYQSARNQGFNDQTIRNAANQTMGNQSQGDWSYLQNKSGYGGGGYGNQFMPQMQTPFSYQPVQQQMQTPFSYPQQPSYAGYGGGYDNSASFAANSPQPMVASPAPNTSSGPSQAIVGRSSQMRGTPNVMRRADGGIASLMDDEE